LAKLLAAPIEVHNIGSDAELTKLGSLLCLPKDKFNQGRAEDSAILVKRILDLVDSVVHEKLDVVNLTKAEELAELVDMGVEALFKIGLKALTLILRDRTTQIEGGRSLANIALNRLATPLHLLGTRSYRIEPIIEHLEDLRVVIVQQDQALLTILRSDHLVKIFGNPLQETLVNREDLALKTLSAK
jgi:hypothetical protein